MKKLLLAVCGGLVVALAALIGAQWLTNPWRHWQPPAVEMPVPNAFDDYRRAGELVSENYDYGDKDQHPFYNTTVRRRILAENSEALRLLRAGFAHAYAEPREHAVVNIAPGDHYYARCRSLARVLSYEAAEFAANGHCGAAIDSQLDAERLGFDLHRRASLYGRLVGDAVRSIGRMDKLVQPRVDQLTGAEARAAAVRLAGMLEGEQSLARNCLDEGDIGQAYYAERAHSRGGWRQLLPFADEQGWPASLPEVVLGPGPWIATLQRYMAAAAAWSRLPWNAAPPPQPSRFFSTWTARELMSVRFKQADADAKDEMFLVALALQAWRAEHGRYPDTLEALVPDILKAVPADPFGRGPLQYRRDGETYVLYSVGPDGRDDGGRPAAFGSSQSGWRYDQHTLESVGDFVWGFWRPFPDGSKP